MFKCYNYFYLSWPVHVIDFLGQLKSEMNAHFTYIFVTREIIDSRDYVQMYSYFV